MYSIGQKVMAQWTDGNWYPGKIVQAEGPHFNVTFDDGANAWVQAHQLQPQAGAAPSKGMGGGGAGGFAVGSRIRRQWTDGNWYSGTIDQVSGNDLHVVFDDGDDAWLASHECQLDSGGMAKGGMPMDKGGMGMGKGGMGMAKGGMAMAKGGGAYSQGQRVKAQWSDGNFYGATITNVMGPDSFMVTFDDGYTATVQSHQIQGEGGMAKGGMAMAKGGGYSVGQRVQAQWSDGNFYGATITQVGGDGRFFVTYDDGYTNWLMPGQIK